MAKHKHGKKRKNPTEVSIKKGKKRIVLGFGISRGERKKALRRALEMRKEIKAAKGSPALQQLGKKLKGRVLKAVKSGRHSLRSLKKRAKAAKKKGWKMSTRHVSFADALQTKKRKKAARKAAKSRKRKHAAKKRAAKKSHPKKRKHSSKKRKTHKKRKAHKKARKSPKRHSKKRSKKSARRRSKRGYWSKRRHAHHLHVSVKGIKKGGKRSRWQKVGKKKFKLSVFRKNPEGGRMSINWKKVITAGNPEQAAYVAGAAALSGVLGALVAKGVDSVTKGWLSKQMNSQSNVVSNLSAALPSIALAIGAEAAGQWKKSDKLEKAGQALMLVAIVDLSETLLGGPLGAMLNKSVPVSGVDFTMGRARRHAVGAIPSMRGVDFTRTGVGAIPAMRGVDFTRTGVGAIPSMRAIPHMRGLTAHDAADFGRASADFGAGVPGETIRSAAGTYKTPADFGAVPAMRGYAHTGDVQLPDDDGDQHPEEAADHMV